MSPIGLPVATVSANAIRACTGKVTVCTDTSHCIVLFRSTHTRTFLLLLLAVSEYAGTVLRRLCDATAAVFFLTYRSLSFPRVIGGTNPAAALCCHNAGMCFQRLCRRQIRVVMAPSRWTHTTRWLPIRTASRSHAPPTSLYDSPRRPSCLRPAIPPTTNTPGARLPQAIAGPPVPPSMPSPTMAICEHITHCIIVCTTYS